ncbi:prepilin-type N-terminal cleavage/methylation domain-containing protein [Puniceicoccus vermicola]|uniref:Prepilin-type N-terminal cleavage/methylation domain-containing protein n=1 Tax=Puniceicoccus vermicola TaxID=388746 RepID=A0A7X1AYF4_9BACT|nr:prepilin-type N-terminal cleavage/methylation domain-containing protein [Puniceicoccus vermicola]MBC2602219.1 prepilin-type N-terminal cleavage/methylation domain-containing protein [Puniceicoccus vermicola]
MPSPIHPSIPLRRKFRSAFTLIELLCVIAVIGILAAIIVPAVGHIRQKGNSSKCQSNLRQLQAANSLYASDHGYFIPSITNTLSSGGKIDRVNWYENPEVLEYMGDQPPLKCPTNLNNKEFKPGGMSGFSYGLNITDVPGGWSEPGKRTARVVEVANPSTTMAFADAVDWQILMYAARSSKDDQYVAHAISYRHNGMANIAFFDGSVVSMSKDEVAGNHKLWKIVQK